MSQSAVYVYLTSTHPNKLLINIVQFSQVDVTVQKRKDFPTAEIMHLTNVYSTGNNNTLFIIHFTNSSICI